MPSVHALSQKQLEALDPSEDLPFEKQKRYLDDYCDWDEEKKSFKIGSLVKVITKFTVRSSIALFFPENTSY